MSFIYLYISFTSFTAKSMYIYVAKAVKKFQSFNMMQPHIGLIHSF